MAHALSAPVNHVLRAESWALRRLAPYAGKTAAFSVPPFSAAFTLRESGEVVAAMSGAVPDVRIRASLPAAARVLTGDEAAYDEVEVAPDVVVVGGVDERAVAVVVAEYCG